MKISVGICTYNGERFIAEQLESVIHQSVKPDEIVVSDDYSSDETVKIVQEVLSSSKIKYQIIENKTHQGIRKNFEKVFRQCTGDVIFSCDQDDIWLESKIEEFLPFFEDGYDFVYSNSCLVDVQRNIIEPDCWKYYGVDFSSIGINQYRILTLTNRTLSGYNMAFSRKLLQKTLPFPEHFIHDDWIALCSSWFGSIKFIDNPLTEYRIHGSNISGFSRKTLEQKSNDQKQISKRRRLFSDELYFASPDTYFGNAHLYLASKVFLERMGDYIDDNFRTLTNDFIEFREHILKCTPKHRLLAIYSLTKELLAGRYRQFRGKSKRFIKDVVFLLVNRNTDFEYDLNIW